jgi:hypothetical protein
MAGNCFIAHLIIRPAFDEPSTAAFEVMIVVMAMPCLVWVGSVWFRSVWFGLGWLETGCDQFVDWNGNGDVSGEVV